MILLFPGLVLYVQTQGTFAFSPMTLVSIEGLQKSTVLAAVYNVAIPVRPRTGDSIGILTDEDAAIIITEQGENFSVLNGRKLFINLSRNQVDPSAFDRMFRAGMFQDLITDLRQTGGAVYSDYIRRQRLLVGMMEFNHQD